MNRLMLIPALLCAMVSLSAQTGKRGVLSVSSVPAGAEVFLDSTFLGTAPLRVDSIPVGKYRLRLAYPTARSWNAFERTEEAEISEESETYFNYSIGSIVMVNTDPPLATVFHHRQPLGVTPLYHRSGVRLSGDLMIVKEGYKEVVLPLRPDQISYELIRLTPLDGRSSNLPEVFNSNDPRDRSDRWGAYFAGASMVGSGVLAAYWKDRANRDYDLYLRTGDNGLRESTRRLDRHSAIALTISHLSFAILTYLLLSD
jgi:hypothetical protein